MSGAPGLFLCGDAERIQVKTRCGCCLQHRGAVRNLPALGVVGVQPQPTGPCLGRGLCSALQLLEDALPGRVSSIVSSVLQSVLWWIPVEKAFWRQVSVGPSFPSLPLFWRLSSLGPRPPVQAHRVLKDHREFREVAKQSCFLNSSLSRLSSCFSLSRLSDWMSLTHQAVPPSFLAASSGEPSTQAP